MAGIVHQRWIVKSPTSEEDLGSQQKHKKPYYDLLWKEYFRDPSQWWDNRNSKIGPACPDFKHKITKHPLWIDGWSNPSWVAHELRRRGQLDLAAAPAQSQAGELSEKAAHLTSPLLCADVGAFVALLRDCAKNKDLYSGTRIHDDILKKDLLVQCSDALVTMYAKCGELSRAKELLDMHKSRNIFTWTTLIAGYARQGHGQDALDCFEQMQGEGLSPDVVTFACILKACGSIKAIDKGEQIHDELTRQGLLGKNIVLSTALVDMYAKCGALAKARRVLEELPSRDVISWSALIAGYAQQGQGEEALKCFELMQHEGVSPDAGTYTCTLKACGSIGAVDKGEQLHDEISRQGLLGKDIVLGTALVDMYAKCGALARAQRVLEELPFRSVVSWNALIVGYAQKGQGEQALNCLERMQHEGVSPNAVTFTCILKACGSIGAIDKGEQIHDEIAKQGLLRNNTVLGNALIDMYAKCGALGKARGVLEGLSSRDVVSWNAVIAGYAQQGQAEQALSCFEEMQCEGLSPDAVTFTCILKACGSSGAAHKGEEIYDEIARQGLLGNNIVLGNAVVDMYAKCGDLPKAQWVLDELPSRDVVSWNALIAGYAQHGQGELALNCFERMQREGLGPDAVTFNCILKACGSIGATDKGEQIYDEIARQGLLESNIVLGNAVVDMFATCGALAKAQQVLEELPSRDVVTWNALIAGYAQQGQGEQALHCFERMQEEDLKPDAVTLSCVLNACSHLGLVEEGHMHFVTMSTKYGIKPDIEHYACMVDVFGRAGHLDRAVGMIQEMPSSDDGSAIWSALLGACQKWGDVNVGRWAFERALRREKSDAAAYVLMANIYSAAGMLEDAENVEAMRAENKAGKKPEHTWWIDNSELVHSFMAGSIKHAQNKYINEKLEDIIHQMSPKDGK